MNTQAVVDVTQVLGVDNKSGKSRTKTYSGVFVRGLRIPSRFSPCKTHSREMFDVANWVAYLNGENGPGGTPSHEALSVSPQGVLEISSVAGQPPSLDRNVMIGADLHPKDHSIQLFTDASNEGWGAHLNQCSTKGLEKSSVLNIPGFVGPGG